MDIQRELSDEEREVVAHRLLAEQRERFDGVRKAAYTAAGVNPATWTRATSGDRVRPDRLVLIVKSLWPESRGRWDLVPDIQTGDWRQVVRYRGPSWVADADEPWVSAHVDLKDYVDEGFANVDQRALDLEERIIELERMVVELVDPDGGKIELIAAANESAGDPLQQEPGAEEGPST